MCDSIKFANMMKRSGLTANEAWYLIRFNEGDMIKYKKNFNKNVSNVNNQSGGSSKSIKYKGVKYVFQQEVDEEMQMLTLRQNMDLSMSTCIHILLDPLYNYAYVENISNLEGCLKRGVLINKGGNDLVKLMILYLHKVKDKYNIKYIQLRDTSTKFINGESIVLRMFMYLTQGKTWYEKFGFVSCEIDTTDKIVFDKNNDKKKLVQWKLYVTKKIKDLMITKKKIKSIFLNYDNKKAKLFFIKIIENENMSVKDFVLMVSADVDLISMLNAFMIKIISKFKLDISQSMCADINNSYDLVINGNV